MSSCANIFILSNLLLACLGLLRYGACPTFIDGTFFCVPHGFKQLIIILCYIAAYDLYVPMWWILLDSKKQIVYECMFDLVKHVQKRYGVPRMEATQLGTGKSL